MTPPALQKNGISSPSVKENGHRFVTLWLVFLMLAGLYVRVYGVDTYYYNPDETFHHAIASGRSVSEVLHFALQETHPPLFYLLLHFWLQIGDSPGFARAMSLCALLLVPLYYAIGKLLHGRTTGICAATLLTFSQGCILQSYLLRHYALLLCFLSLSLYFYLRWRHSHGTAPLTAYCACAMLACLTHFFAICAIFSIALYETVAQFRENGVSKRLFGWMMLNAAIALVWGLAILTWHEALMAWMPASEQSSTLPGIYYPWTLAGYLFPTPYALFLLLLLLPLERRPERALKDYLWLCAVAFTAGFAENTRDQGMRHHIWLVPFLLPLFAWLLADGFTWLAARRNIILPLPAIAVVVLGACMAGYLSVERFPRMTVQPGSEYTLKAEDRRQLVDYLSHLDATHLIVASRTSVFLLDPPAENPFRLMEHSYTRPALAALMPYYKAQLVFHPSYYVIDPMEMFRDKDVRDALEKVDTVVFVHLPWAPLPLESWLFCPALKAQIVTFPPWQATIAPTRAELDQTPVTLIIVARKDLEAQMLAPEGSCHKTFISPPP